VRERERERRERAGEALADAALHPSSSRRGRRSLYLCMPKSRAYSRAGCRAADHHHLCLPAGWPAEPRRRAGRRGAARSSSKQDKRARERERAGRGPPAREPHPAYSLLQPTYRLTLILLRLTYHVQMCSRGVIRDPQHAYSAYTTQICAYYSSSG
jgi:hypothetical protein